MAEPDLRPNDYFYGPMWGWFSLSYAGYLVVPRVALCSMPREWQERMVALLEEMGETIEWVGASASPTFSTHAAFRFAPCSPKGFPMGEEASAEAAWARVQEYIAYLHSALKPFSAAAEWADGANAASEGPTVTRRRFAREQVEESAFADAFGAYSERVDPDDFEAITEALAALSRSSNAGDGVVVPTEEMARAVHKSTGAQMSWEEDAEQEACWAAVRAVLSCLSQTGAPISYTAWQQRRGRLPDLIEEAIEIHNEFMKDDNYDAYGCLDRIIAKLKTASDFYDVAAAPSPALPIVEGAIPAGMKAWRGGNIAPEDWDGGHVETRNNDGRKIKFVPARDSAQWQYNIIAYTPKAPVSPSMVEREAVARIIDGTAWSLETRAMEAKMDVAGEAHMWPDRREWSLAKADAILRLVTPSALAVAVEALKQAKAALSNYAEPSGYNDNMGEPYEDGDTHPGLLAAQVLLEVDAALTNLLGEVEGG